MREAECPICLQMLLPSEGRDSSSPKRDGANNSTVPQTVSESTTSTGEGFSILFSANAMLNYTRDMARSLASSLELLHSLSTHGSASGEAPQAQIHPACSSGEQNDVAVLPCGHMLHFLCANQLYEYRKSATCPICREPIRDLRDILLFAPRGRQPTTSVGNASIDTGDVCSEDVHFAGMRQIPVVSAYSRQLDIESEGLKKRRQNLRNRENDLSSSRGQLEDQCLELEQSLSEARRRYEILTQQGTVGIERLEELRTVARSTHASIALVTAELAKLTRERIMLDRELGRYSDKLQRREARSLSGNHCRGLKRQAETVPGDEDNRHKRGSGGSWESRRRRTTEGEHGVSIPYYVSYD
ncbi:hypothetical protein TRVL_06948 [Trypanosoma vivax]|nr:hypothetical protein TRVL_06948 [Trypanosoma vivax]